MVPSDEDLMRRTRASEPPGQDLEALGRLFDRHQPSLFAFLCRLVGNTANAEDLVQATFLRVWRYRNAFDGSRRFSTWLYAIARNLAVDELGRSSRSPRPLSTLDLEDETAPVQAAGPGFSDPGAAAENAELNEQIRTALLGLPVDQRTALVLREYEGRSHREIAAIMGCSEGNARVLVHRARRLLRARLRPLIESEECCV